MTPEPVHPRVGVFELVNVVLRRWRLVLTFPFVCAVLAALVVLLVRPKYTATAVFAPENKKSSLNLAGVAGLAAELGMGLPGMDNSAAFYADVLESRGVRDSVLLVPYNDPRSDAASPQANLLDILEIKGRNPAERLDLGREKINSIVSIAVDGSTNIVRIAVKTYYPQLSADIANRFIDLLNEFNSKVRETSGSARRKFAEQRLAQSRQELTDAEAAATVFMQRNRSYERSPELTFEYNRLQREIQVKDAISSKLRQDYEEARIQEVNDTPLITVIDHALPPGRKSSPRRTLTVILTFVLGALGGLLIAFTQDYIERARTEDAEHFAEASSRVGQITRQIRGLIAPRRNA